MGFSGRHTLASAATAAAAKDAVGRKQQQQQQNWPSSAAGMHAAHTAQVQPSQSSSNSSHRLQRQQQQQRTSVAVQVGSMNDKGIQVLLERASSSVCDAGSETTAVHQQADAAPIPATMKTAAGTAAAAAAPAARPAGLTGDSLTAALAALLATQSARGPLSSAAGINPAGINLHSLPSMLQTSTATAAGLQAAAAEQQVPLGSPGFLNPTPGMGLLPASAAVQQLRVSALLTQLRGLLSRLQAQQPLHQQQLQQLQQLYLQQMQQQLFQRQVSPARTSPQLATQQHQLLSLLLQQQQQLYQQQMQVGSAPVPGTLTQPQTLQDALGPLLQLQPQQLAQQQQQQELRSLSEAAHHMPLQEGQQAVAAPPASNMQSNTRISAAVTGSIPATASNQTPVRSGCVQAAPGAEEQLTAATGTQQQPPAHSSTQQQPKDLADDQHHPSTATPAQQLPAAAQGVPDADVKDSGWFTIPLPCAGQESASLSANAKLPGDMPAAAEVEAAAAAAAEPVAHGRAASSSTLCDIAEASPTGAVQQSQAAPEVVVEVEDTDVLAGWVTLPGAELPVLTASAAAQEAASQGAHSVAGDPSAQPRVPQAALQTTADPSKDEESAAGGGWFTIPLPQAEPCPQPQTIQQQQQQVSAAPSDSHLQPTGHGMAADLEPETEGSMQPAPGVTALDTSATAPPATPGPTEAQAPAAAHPAAVTAAAGRSQSTGVLSTALDVGAAQSGLLAPPTPPAPQSIVSVQLVQPGDGDSQPGPSSPQQLQQEQSGQDVGGAQQQQRNDSEVVCSSTGQQPKGDKQLPALSSMACRSVEPAAAAHATSAEGFAAVAHAASAEGTGALALTSASAAPAVGLQEQQQQAGGVLVLQDNQLAAQANVAPAVLQAAPSSTRCVACCTYARAQLTAVHTCSSDGRDGSNLQDCSRYNEQLGDVLLLDSCNQTSFTISGTLKVAQQHQQQQRYNHQQDPGLNMVQPQPQQQPQQLAAMPFLQYTDQQGPHRTAAGSYSPLDTLRRYQAFLQTGAAGLPRDSAAALQLDIGQAVAAAEQHHQQRQYAQGPVNVTPVLLQLQKLHSSLAAHTGVQEVHTDTSGGTGRLKVDQLMT
jgi:hypothetical protein